MSAEELYVAMVTFLIAHGCRREELGSGWWLSADLGEEMLMGAAVERLLESSGLDLRVAIPDEPQEFWG